MMMKSESGKRCIAAVSDNGGFPTFGSFEEVGLLSIALVGVPISAEKKRRRRAEPRDATGLADDCNGKRCTDPRDGCNCLPGRRQQLLAQHAVKSGDTIVVGQEFVTKLPDQFGLERRVNGVAHAWRQSSRGSFAPCFAWQSADWRLCAVPLCPRPDRAAGWPTSRHCGLPGLVGAGSDGRSATPMGFGACRKTLHRLLCRCQD